MRGQIAAMILTGIAAAGMFAALNSAHQPQPVPPRMVAFAPKEYPSNANEPRVSQSHIARLPTRRIRCADLSGACFHKRPMQ
jgi:hypothetical protein